MEAATCLAIERMFKLSKIASPGEEAKSEKAQIEGVHCPTRETDKLVLGQ